MARSNQRYSSRTQAPVRNLRIAVVGGGAGGLTAAAVLAQRGAQVTLFERAPRVGGKMRQSRHPRFPIDIGPTVLTMRWVFEQIFRDLNTTMDAHLQLDALDVLAHHHWPDGARLDLFDNIERSAEAIGAMAGATEKAAFERFVSYCRRIYESAEGPFILAPKPTLRTLFGALGGLDGIRRLRRIDSLRTMWRALEGFFADPRLLQLFGRYATYYGSSPFLAPATLNLIAHVELAGVWTVRGGMYRLAQTLQNLGQEAGVELRCSEEVARVETQNGQVHAVHTREGKTLTVDAVVLNTDVSAGARGLLGRDIQDALRPVEPHQRSLSAMTLAWGATLEEPAPAFHNVYFSGNYHQEFEDIVEGRRLPRDPTVYLCVQGHMPNASANERGLFTIVNAPASGDGERFSAEAIEACQHATLERLQQGGLRMTPQTPFEVTTPHDFEAAFPATGGALYGAATHSWRAPMQRAGSRTKVSGLYLASGSAHPGAGVPMAALGGRMAADQILQDLASTALPPLTGTSGGTLTD